MQTISRAEERVNVLHIRDSNGIYGAERVILTLGRHLDKSRYNIMLLCMRRRDGRSEPLMKSAIDFGIPVFPVEVKGRFDIRALSMIRSIIREQKISILHSHDFKSDFYAMLSSLHLPVKLISTAHGSTRDSLLKRIYLYFNERIVYRAFDSVIAVSEDLKLQLAPYLNKGKVTVIRNGVDAGLLEGNGAKAAELPLPISNGNKVFAVVGRLFPDKGHRYFLEAFSKLRSSHSDATGLIIGDGPEREAIARQVKELGLEQTVFLCGVRSDMKYIYKNIDCLVIPSLTEGLPYALLEAVENRVPVVATSVGDIPALIHDEKTGYLAAPGDVAALKDGMLKFLDHPENSAQMAEEAHKILQEKFTARKMASETAELYTRVLLSRT